MYRKIAFSSLACFLIAQLGFFLVVFSVPASVQAKQEIVLQEVEVLEDGRLSVEYFTNDLTSPDSEAHQDYVPGIVYIELVVNDQMYHKWHRNKGDDTSLVSYGTFFNQYGIFVLENDDQQYPAGDYQLKMVYDENTLSTAKTFLSNTENFQPPDENRSAQTHGVLPLDQKIHEYYNIGVRLASPIAIIVLIWGGYLYITSTGNPEKIGAAKELMFGAITGIIILLLAGLILSSIGRSTSDMIPTGDDATTENADTTSGDDTDTTEPTETEEPAGATGVSPSDSIGDRDFRYSN